MSPSEPGASVHQCSVAAGQPERPEDGERPPPTRLFTSALCGAESLEDSEITPGDPCAKFEDDNLLVWQQWGSGGTGAALVDLDFSFHDTPTTWKLFAYCEHLSDEYSGILTIHPVDGFEGYFQKVKCTSHDDHTHCGMSAV